MGRTMSIVFYIVIIINIVILALMFKQMIRITDEPVTFNINGHSVIDNNYYGEITEMTILGKRFAAYHNYSQNYSCLNYTQDFQQVASMLGFDTEVVTGYKFANLTEGHAWVKVIIDYEPQSGSFVDYDKIYPFKVG